MLLRADGVYTVTANSRDKPKPEQAVSVLEFQHLARKKNVFEMSTKKRSAILLSVLHPIVAGSTYGKSVFQ